jgi:hypothetical protein
MQPPRVAERKSAEARQQLQALSPWARAVSLERPSSELRSVAPNSTVSPDLPASLDHDVH